MLFQVYIECSNHFPEVTTLMQHSFDPWILRSDAKPILSDTEQTMAEC